MESENPYSHVKEFKEVCNTFQEGGASIALMRLKLFPFTLKDKAKIWLNSLRLRTKENEKFYECWERYMEAINACPHHGFDTWLLVSYFYDDINMKAKVAAMVRRLEELEMKKHLVEECPTILAVREMFGDQANGIHEVEAQEGESSKVREFKAVITLRSGKEVDQPTSKPKHDGESVAEKGKMLRQVKVNIPLLHMIKQVPTYAKFLNDLCIVKRGFSVNKKAFLIEQVSAIIQCKSPVKYKDQGCPTILVRIGGTCVEKTLLDLEASVNLLPYSVYKQLGLGELKPTSITLSLADRSVKIPRGMIKDVLVQVDKFYYPVDFVVLDTDPVVKGTNYVPIILGRPFLATSNAIINCRNGVMQLAFGNMTLELNIFICARNISIRKKKKGYLNPQICLLPCLFRGGEKKFYLCSMRRRHKELLRRSPQSLFLSHYPQTEFKYAYLEEDKQCPIVISSALTIHQEDCLLEVLRRCKKAIG
ncbi:hypothetical protein CK203_057570 [Vitis vinifera]|uniref:Retrotransposon gag domain-containing protein n=1 Tax=Vitis vinifera TaxID=29760 RepID=A0A438GGX0_VITVI|nr:hypothetical protein CK203_057570 [Vitis vinifera]